MINLRDEVLEYLITNACASIALRTKENIVNKRLSENEKKNYINRIKAEDKINTVLSWQTPEGYFGTRLHTPPSNSKVWPHEGCVRYLLEKGLGIDYIPLRKALDAMLVQGWGKECEGTKAGEAFGYGMIRSSLFAQAQLHEQDFMQEWIDIALQGFRNVAEASSYNDIAIPYKAKYIFAPGKYLPTIYLLRTLAFTTKWRTSANLDMIAQAYRNLYYWLPFPQTYIKVKSQLVAPAGNIMLPYNQNISESLGFWWFSFYELSARMGMLGKNKPFRKHLDALNEYLDKHNGFFIENYNKRGYEFWSGYSGMALEDNWTKKQKKINDLTFRCHFINALADITV